MLLQKVFQKWQTNHLSSELKKSFLSPCDIEVAVLIKITEISSSISKLSVFFPERAFKATILITRENTRSTVVNHPLLIRVESFITFKIKDFKFSISKSDSYRLSFLFFNWINCNNGTTFSNSVAFKDFRSWDQLFEFFKDLL